MKLSKVWSNMTLRTKLIASLMLASMLPIGALSYTYTKSMGAAMETQAFNQLESIRELKKSQIESYFQTIRDQVTTVSQSGMTVRAMREFATSFSMLQRDPYSNTTVDRSTLSSHYQANFGQEFQRQTGSTKDTDSLLPKSAAALRAQVMYIADNPNPLGNKHVLDAAKEANQYNAIHSKYHAWYRDYLEKFGYYDIFLVEPENGHIVYSVFKEIDYGTSLMNGPYKDSNIARVFRDAMGITVGNATNVDFEHYVPSYNAPAAFIASPVFDGQSLVGVLIFQMPVGEINGIMGETSGLGETGESYLVGEDLLMRTQSRFTEDNSILATRIDTDATSAIAEGNTGFGAIKDYRGVDVFSSYTPVAIEGMSWGIIAEIDEAEALAAVKAMNSSNYISLSIGAVFGILLALTLTWSVMRKLGEDPTRLSEVATAIANNDLDIDLSTDEPATGVFGEMQLMQQNLKQRMEEDQRQLAENGRIRQALQTVDGNVLIADADHEIIYVNDSVASLFSNIEADIKSDLPNFDAKSMVGKNLGSLEKEPEQYLNSIHNLTDSLIRDIHLGSRVLKTVSNPVFGPNGERLGTVVEWFDLTSERQIEAEVQQVVEAAMSGDLSRRIKIQGMTGFYDRLSDNVNQLMNVSDGVIQDTLRVLSAMAQGNLTKTIDADYGGSYGSLKVNANATVEKLTEVVGNIMSASGAVKTGAAEIAIGNTNLSERTEQQASSLEETASSMQDMTNTVKQNAENALTANQLAMQARDKAEKGGHVVNNAVSAMEEISDSSKKISDIIGVIDEIAFQTNLLALNASVEAARAGDQGRGFAVVASEVRNLAGRSADAAKEIKTLIEDSEQKVQDGSKLVNESGETLRDIVDQVKKVTAIVGEIAEASRDQAAGVDEVNKAVTQLDELTQQNAALVEQASAASQSMGDQADQLDSMMEFFTVSPRTDSAETTPTKLRRVV